MDVRLVLSLRASIGIRINPNFSPAVSKLRPAGQMRPAKSFHPAREAILSMMKKIMLKKTANVFTKNLSICENITYTETIT